MWPRMCGASGSLESHCKHQLEVERLIAMEFMKLFVSNFVPDAPPTKRIVELWHLADELKS